VRVLITGASGFLGSAVCDALLARGDEPVGLSREPERARRGNPTVTWHAWNPTAERPPASALEGVGGVINLVGEPIGQRWTEPAKRRIRDSRERATKNLVDAISAADPRPGTFVSQSGVGYYGDRGEALVDESTEPGSTFDAEVCVAWEAAAREAEKVGVRVVVTRSGLVLDPEHGLLKQLLLPFKLGVGGPLAGGGQYMPWIHVDDEVRLLQGAELGEVLDGWLAARPTTQTGANSLGPELASHSASTTPSKGQYPIGLGVLLEDVADRERRVPLGRKPFLAAAIRDD